MSQRNPNDEAPTANLPTTNAPTVQPLPTNVPRTKLPTSRVPTANVPTANVPTPNTPKTQAQSTQPTTPNTPTTNSQHAGSLPADATPTGSKHIIDNSQDSPKRLRVSDNNIGRGAPHQHPRQQPPQQPPRNPSHLNPNSWSLGLPFPGWRAPDVTPPNLTSVSPQGSGLAGVIRPTYNPPTIETATVTFSFQIKRKTGTMGIDDGAFSRTIAHLEDEFPGADVRFSVEKS